MYLGINLNSHLQASMVIFFPLELGSDRFLKFEALLFLSKLQMQWDQVESKAFTLSVYLQLDKPLQHYKSTFTPNLCILT